MAGEVGLEVTLERREALGIAGQCGILCWVLLAGNPLKDLRQVSSVIQLRF